MALKNFMVWKGLPWKTGRQGGLFTKDQLNPCNINHKGFTSETDKNQDHSEAVFWRFAWRFVFIFLRATVAHNNMQFGMKVCKKIAEEAEASPAIAAIILLEDTTIRIYIHAIYSLYP
jgi:hypothetical protein